MHSASQRLMKRPEAEVLPLTHTGDSQKTLLKLAFWREVVGSLFFLFLGGDLGGVGDLKTKETEGISI